MRLRKNGPIDLVIWPRSAHQNNGLCRSMMSIIRSTIWSVGYLPQTTSGSTQMFSFSSSATGKRQVLSRSCLEETAWSLAT